MKIIFLLLLAINICFSSPIKPSDSSLPKTLMSALFLSSYNGIKANCELADQDLEQWMSLVDFLQGKVDHPIGSMASCEFYDWLDSTSSNYKVFQFSPELKAVKNIRKRDYFWNFKFKKIEKTASKNSSVSYLLEAMGNKYLGVDRGLSSWNPEEQIDPFLYWRDAFNRYLQSILPDYRRENVFEENQSKQISAFLIHENLKKHMNNVHLFKSEYWLTTEDNSEVHLGSILSWKDVRNDHSLCFKVDNVDSVNRFFASVPKSFLTYKNYQNNYELFNQVKNCSNGRVLLSKLIKWKNLVLLGYGPKQLVGMIKEWKFYQRYFQDHQKSQEVLLNYLGQ